MQTVINTILVDARNIKTFLPVLLEKAAAAALIGFDLETQDSEAHDGVKEFRKGARHAFDWNKMVVTGLSFYFPEEAGEEPVAYYLNLNHADVENRLAWDVVKSILDAKKPTSSWICHNAPFELTVMANTYGYVLDNVICTLQMAVSAYGPDQYEKEDYIKAQFGDIKTLFPEAERLFRDFEPALGRNGMNFPQNQLLGKVLGKSSDAVFSYNGFIDTISYGYGLKKAVMSFFGHKMTTYEEVLGEKDHMGELTGDEVSAYGAEDAYWAVRLFYKLYQFMTENCPESIETFFSQENPMIYVYSEIRQTGVKINLSAVEARREVERHNFAEGLRKLKATALQLLPFPEELNEKLAKYDSWYGPNPKKPDSEPKGQEHRDRLERWIRSPDSPSDFDQCSQVSSSVTSAWKLERGDLKKSKEINVGYYYQSRLFMYDLCRTDPITSKGKVQSDAESRGTLKERFEWDLKDEKSKTDKGWLKLCISLMDCLNELANIETRMKLYLNPYMLLTDPKTERMYPEISSMLATRRMAGSNPNPMQLAKRGESTYVRGFYLPDEKDHVFIAPDWSQIELVLIGEFSGDPEFAKAFGQTPYQDLHLGAAADVLGVQIEGVTEELLKGMHKMDEKDIPPGLLIKPNGEPMNPSKAKKYWRTEVGKGSNFNYWYSGALSTVGEKLGWTSEQMWEATEAYRTRFAAAEAWRVGVIEQAKWDGYVILPDGHRRTRWEITHEWATMTHRMFDAYNQKGILKFGEQIIKATRTRAGNQLVNALIQGSCSTLAKRSILSINEIIKADGYRAKFKIPVHDELVYSVHKDEAIEFIRMIRHQMSNHPDIIGNLKIDCSVALGRTFEPFDQGKLPTCLIELDEAPDILGFEEGSKMNEDQVREAIDYLFSEAA